MVRQDTSYSYKIIKSPSFGISYDLLKSLDDNPEIHSLNNKNINSFTESFHSLKTYYDHLTIICKVVVLLRPPISFRGDEDKNSHTKPTECPAVEVWN